MTIKHTHPTYENDALRRERLADVKRACAALLRSGKGSNEKAAR